MGQQLCVILLNVGGPILKREKKGADSGPILHIPGFGPTDALKLPYGV